MTLVRQSGPIKYIYFPGIGAYSCIVNMKDGSGVEVATIGSEGFTNIEMLLDATIATETVVCQVSGTSLQIGADDFRTMVPDARALNRIFRCSRQAYLAQSIPIRCLQPHSQHRFTLCTLAFDHT
jgi:CRP-like cAMP-binding protein